MQSWPWKLTYTKIACSWFLSWYLQKSEVSRDLLGQHSNSHWALDSAPVVFFVSSKPLFLIMCYVCITTRRAQECLRHSLSRMLSLLQDLLHFLCSLSYLKGTTACSRGRLPFPAYTICVHPTTLLLSDPFEVSYQCSDPFISLCPYSSTSTRPYFSLWNSLLLADFLSLYYSASLGHWISAGMLVPKIQT